MYNENTLEQDNKANYAALTTALHHFISTIIIKMFTRLDNLWQNTNSDTRLSSNAIDVLQCKIISAASQTYKLTFQQGQYRPTNSRIRAVIVIIFRVFNSPIAVTAG